LVDVAEKRIPYCECLRGRDIGNIHLAEKPEMPPSAEGEEAHLARVLEIVK
jgi:hypothetical protein